MNKSDNSYAQKWAKKTRAVNYLGGRCLDCGTQNIVILEFHHIIKKDFGVCNCFGNRWSKLVVELEKCSLLCRNCHRKKHNKDNRSLKIKEALLRIKGASKCAKCGNDDIKILEFHHKDELHKGFSIGNLVARRIAKISFERILTEIESCSVLCRNCHAKQHFDYARFERLRDEIEKRVLFGELRKLDHGLILSEYEKLNSKHAVSRNNNIPLSSVRTVLKKYGK